MTTPSDRERAARNGPREERREVDCIANSSEFTFASVHCNFNSILAKNA